MMEEFDRMIPNGAERIMAMAEEQSAHRRAIEKNRCASQDKQSERGQIFAFVLALVLIGAGIFAITREHAYVAGIIFGTTVVSLAGVFVVGRWKQIKNLAKRE